MSRGDPDEAVGVFRRLGALLADDLLRDVEGGVISHTGWRGTLEVTCDLTHNDHRVLDLADRIHRHAGGLRTTAAIRDFATGLLCVEPTGASAHLLEGLVCAVTAPGVRETRGPRHA